MKPLANCKTYVEGKGWLYNFELNREETKTKTASELIDDIFGRNQRLKATIDQLKANNGNLEWTQPTKDQSYIRDRELQNKYQ